MPERTKRIKFILPPDSVIPPAWIVERGEGFMLIAFPSWGRGPKQVYNIRLDAKTRELTCDPDCPSFKYHGYCHHIAGPSGLLWVCHKPDKSKGPIWARNMSYWGFTEEELDERQRQVYKGFKHYGPISNRRLTEALGWQGAANRVTGRCKELRGLGCVAEWGSEWDKVTERTVTLWFACAEMPEMGVFPWESKD